VLPDKALGDLADPRLLAPGAVNDLVVHIREVLHVSDVPALGTEMARDHIKNDRRAGMPHVAYVIRRDPAYIDPDFPLLQRLKFLFLFRLGIKDF